MITVTKVLCVYFMFSSENSEFLITFDFSYEKLIFQQIAQIYVHIEIKQNPLSNVCLFLILYNCKYFYFDLLFLACDLVLLSSITQRTSSSSSFMSLLSMVYFWSRSKNDIIPLSFFSFLISTFSFNAGGGGGGGGTHTYQWYLSART